MNKRRQSLLFNISTAGDTIEGPCYRMQQDVQLILEGQYENDRMFAVIYDVDEDVPWTSREALIMANPNFGVSIDAEALEADQQDAIRNAAKQNGFRCKNQNFWAQQTSAWMNMELWDQCKVTGLTEDDCAGWECVHGSDLAFTLDLAGTVRLFSRAGEDGRLAYRAFATGYAPLDRIQDPANQTYQAWHKADLLIGTPGNEIDFKQIENDTVADIQRFRIKELAYDSRYGAQWSQQVGARTDVDRVVIAPSPEQFSPAMVELESAVAGGRFEHDGNPVLRWCVANLIARRDMVTGNYHMPMKADGPNGKKKIDLAVALLIAMARARLAVPESVGTGVVEWF